MATLTVTDLTVRYGAAEALHGVCLDFPHGQTTAVLGANGAGKSSLLRAIMGLVPATGGSVMLEGTELRRRRPAEIARLGLGFVPEGRSLFPSLSVHEHLLVGAAHARPGPRSERERIESVYDMFPTLRGRDRFAAITLSGGEQQMVAIGRALVANPAMLLLDEPSLGLAPKLVAQVLGVVGELRRAGTSIVLVEQNARAALRIADRAYVLNTGSVELAGSAAELAADDTVQRAYLGG